MRVQLFVQGAGLCMLVVLGACGGGSAATVTSPAGGGGGGGGGVVADQVTATNGSQFTPSPLNTQVGHTVTWVFLAQAHNVQFDVVAGAPASIGGSNTNTSIGRLFSTVGTFTYICGIHGASMSGSVVVTP